MLIHLSIRISGFNSFNKKCRSNCKRILMCPFILQVFYLDVQYTRTYSTIKMFVQYMHLYVRYCHDMSDHCLQHLSMQRLVFSFSSYTHWFLYIRILWTSSRMFFYTFSVLITQWLVKESRTEWQTAVITLYFIVWYQKNSELHLTPMNVLSK